MGARAPVPSSGSANGQRCILCTFDIVAVVWAFNTSNVKINVNCCITTTGRGDGGVVDYYRITPVL